ncbi:putative bifunctional diguanylate cyclase/phosphodiesterase [Erythrobacter sp. HA6-11]
MYRSQSTAHKKAESILHEIYRPILRGYFAAFALYYFAMFPTHLLYFTGLERIQMGSLSFIAGLIGTYGFVRLRKPAHPDHSAAIFMVMNISVVFNVMAALTINFQPEKLTYFIMMVMVFGLASSNLRHSFLSIGLALLAMLYFLPRADASTDLVYAFLTFAAAMASLSIAYLLRNSIMDIAKAKLAAQGQLEEAKVIGQELREKSLSDSLTKLPNRRAFFGALRNSLTRVAASQVSNDNSERGWLMLIDLDGFKTVNDIHGHMTGDALLQEVSQRLKLCTGQGTHVSRMGGDEFNVLLTSAQDDEEIRARCEAWLMALSKPYAIDGRHVQISASIGCKELEPGVSSRAQISQADYALMVAKKQGKNRVVIFNDDHALQAEAQHEVERALRNANLADEITLVFQPQFDLAKNQIVRAEALARWESPSIGNVEPRRFIRIAEESGLITGITLTVAQKAFAALTQWDDPLPISVNLSSFDLMSDPTITQIIKLATDYAIDPSLVEFEVTETAMMADFDKANANLRKLTAHGFTIALDDFGTGYSNFSYLRALPIQKLKVDCSFLDNPSDPLTSQILNSLAGMSRVLGLSCLIEGVEDEIDLLIAKRSGVELIQGFYIGEPMLAEELHRMRAAQPRDLPPHAVNA